MDVSCCPRCASPDIRAASMSDGVVAGGGELMLYVCRSCNFRGSPVYFDSEEAYQEFRAEVRSGSTAPVADEDMPQDIRDILETRPPGPPRVTATFIGLGSLVFLVPGALALFAAALGLVVGQLNLVGLAVGALMFFVGVAGLLVARRMWRGTGATGSPGPQPEHPLDPPQPP